MSARSAEQLRDEEVALRGADAAVAAHSAGEARADCQGGELIDRIAARAPGSSWRQSTRIVQLKRRPTSNVDSMMVLRARRGGTGSKYVTLRGGLRRAIPFL